MFCILGWCIAYIWVGGVLGDSALLDGYLDLGQVDTQLQYYFA